MSDGFLHGNNGPKADGYLRPRAAVKRFDGFLHAHNGPKADGYLRPNRWGYSAVAAPLFPVQFAGLRYFLGVVKELALVALADAPPGDQWRVRKGGMDYAVYLVPTTDPNASQVRVMTSEGLKAARLKTA